ncbi:MAG TPA: Crp/Fnr family transcriptional regulator [Anaerolineaceae bacterium]
MKAQGGSANEIVHLLKSNPLFSGLTEKTMDALLRASRLKPVEEGGAIFLQADPPEAAYIVRSGAVEITLTSPDGRQLVINEMRQGDCFGELALVTGKRRSANALVGEAGEVLVIPRHAFLMALETEPSLALRLLKTTAQRLSNSSEFESGLAFLDAQARVARLLIELDQQAGGGPVVASQEELADRTGLIRQTVAKTLGEWRRRGWIQTGRGRIQILDRAALEHWLSERGK